MMVRDLRFDFGDRGTRYGVRSELLPLQTRARLRHADSEPFACAAQIGAEAIHWGAVYLVPGAGRGPLAVLV